MRKRRTSNVGWATLVLFAFTMVSGCDTLEKLALSQSTPTARLERVGIESLTLETATLSLDVEVSNPLGVALPLTDLEYALSSGSSQLVTGRAELDGSIPAGSSRTVSVPAMLRFADVLGAMSGVRPGAVVPYTVDATFSVDAPGLGPIQLPLRKAGELPVPAVPGVEIAGIRWDRLSLDEATAVLDLRVTNANAFAVDLQEMTYELSLGGARVVGADVARPTSFDDGETHTLEVPISFRPRDLGLAALNMLRSSGADYRLAGTMRFQTPFGPIELPYDRAGETEFTR